MGSPARRRAAASDINALTALRSYRKSFGARWFRGSSSSIRLVVCWRVMQVPVHSVPSAARPAGSPPVCACGRACARAHVRACLARACVCARVLACLRVRVLCVRVFARARVHVCAPLCACVFARVSGVTAVGQVICVSYSLLFLLNQSDNDSW